MEENTNIAKQKARPFVQRPADSTKYWLNMLATAGVVLLIIFMQIKPVGARKSTTSSDFTIEETSSFEFAQV